MLGSRENAAIMHNLKRMLYNKILTHLLQEITLGNHKIAWAQNSNKIDMKLTTPPKRESEGVTHSRS